MGEQIDRHREINPSRRSDRIDTLLQKPLVQLNSYTLVQHVTGSIKGRQMSFCFIQFITYHTLGY